MALTDLTRISTSGIATGSTIDAAILRKDVSFRGSQVGVQTALFDASDDELKFQPNAKLSFSGTALQIYHGSNVSHIAENGTGPLRLSTDEFQLMNSAQNKTMIYAAQNLAVSLNYNGNTKFQTTDHGAIVTGILTATSFSGPLNSSPINNPSGISTFYDLRVSNNLTVEGTTTTLDTNLIGVDRIEVGANSNSIVGVAITQSGTADILNLYDGSTEVFSVADGGAVSTKSLTATGNINVASGDIIFSHSNHKIQCASSASTLNIQGGASNPGGKIELRGGTSDNNIIFLTSDGSGNSVEKFRIHNNGNVGVNSTSPTSKLDVVGDVKITGIVTATSFSGSASNLTGLPVQTSIVNYADNKLVTATGNATTLNAEAGLTFDGNVMSLGGDNAAGGGLYINGGTVNNPGGRDAKLYIDDPTNNDWAIFINKPSNNYGIQMLMSNSASHAFYIIGGGAEKFRITGSGDIAKSGNIYPRSADTFDIGDNGTSRWRNIYSEKLFADDLIRLGTPPWNEASGDFRTLSISGKTASSSGFIYLGNNVATNNADFDLGRIRIHNGATEVAMITGTTDTSANDDGRITFSTKKTGGSLTERLRIDSSGRVLVSGEAALTSTSLSHSLQVATSSDADGIAIIGRAADDIGEISFYEADKTTNLGEIQYRRTETNIRARSAGAEMNFATTTSGGSMGDRLTITADGKIGINQTDIDADLHIATLGSSEQDGTLKIGGSEDSLGLLFEYDQAGATVSKITANPTYSNNSSLLKICVDGDGNPDQLVLSGAGKIGINIADNTAADLQVRTGSNGAGVFRLGGSNGNGVGMDATYSNSGATSTIFKQNYRATHAGALMEFDSGYFNFRTGTGGDFALKISKHGQLLVGNSSEDQGFATFFNAPGSGADAGTAGTDNGGDKGVNIRSDMGPTHLDLTGVDNYTLKLANQAYSGAGVANPYGTISKLFFNTVTYNGWNSYGAIALQSVGVSAAKGEMVFMLNNGTSSMNEKMRIKSTLIETANNTGMEIYGGDINHPNDSVFFVRKTSNADWAIKCDASHSNSSDYGMFSRVDSGASYAIGVNNTSSWTFRVTGNGVIYATNTSLQSISDVRLKENIVDANSQWDDIKALRFRNFNWKSDSGYADGKTYLGLIAQEVEPISPNLIEIDAQDKEDIENGVPDPEYKTVNYSIVWMKAVKALQEAQARIETLEAKVAALEGS